MSNTCVRTTATAQQSVSDAARTLAQVRWGHVPDVVINPSGVPAPCTGVNLALASALGAVIGRVIYAGVARLVRGY